MLMHELVRGIMGLTVVHSRAFRIYSEENYNNVRVIDKYWKQGYSTNTVGCLWFKG